MRGYYITLTKIKVMISLQFECTCIFVKFVVKEGDKLDATVSHTHIYREIQIST